MTIASDRVESFLVRHRGEAYCEECIQREVGIARRRQVHHALDCLHVERDQRFIQLRRHCTVCGMQRLVSARA